MPAPGSPRTPTNADVFPLTQMTWIGRHLDQGDPGRGEVNRHVMALYAWPLKVYFLGTRDRWIGDPDEVVNGFFADRLARPGFFDGWRRSGLRLRHWLINAFCFYLRELKRAHARDRHAPEEPDTPVPAAVERDFDRAFVASMVRQAIEQARQTCEDGGLNAHWQVFTEHFIRGREYESFVSELGIDPARAVVMARTAKKRFQAALRELVSHDAASADIDAEIRSLLEAS
ncbi:MAG: hypothetical protein HRU70_06615 [Phycisphaeraceae bacterium]|nr:MAG: hypothetical protein HRU70_06615 [Phycisphaeraceae bacterium]